MEAEGERKSTVRVRVDVAPTDPRLHTPITFKLTTPPLLFDQTTTAARRQRRDVDDSKVAPSRPHPGPPFQDLPPPPPPPQDGRNNDTATMTRRDDSDVTSTRSRSPNRPLVFLASS